MFMMHRKLTSQTLTGMDTKDPLFVHKLYCLATQSKLSARGFPRDEEEFIDQAAESYEHSATNILTTICIKASENFDWNAHGVYTKGVDNDGSVKQVMCWRSLSADLPMKLENPDEYVFDTNWDEYDAVLRSKDGKSSYPMRAPSSGRRRVARGRALRRMSVTVTAATAQPVPRPPRAAAWTRPRPSPVRRARARARRARRSQAATMRSRRPRRPRRQQVAGSGR